MKKGIPQIKIPIRQSDLSIENIEPYLNSVYSQFEKNALQIRRDYDFYCLDHPILSKVRPHDDTDVNNKVLIPDLNSMINWKTGYVFGNPIKYAQNKTSDTDDINYLNKYVRSACQRTVDKNVGTWAYATGVGYYFIEPKSTDFDIENEAPYILYSVDSDTCSKVYSSFLGNKPLFDMICTCYEIIKEDETKETVKVLDIYLQDTLYRYENKVGVGKWTRISTESRGTKKPLPLVEKRFNPDGIGIVAMGESMQEAVDRAISSGLDNIEDIVNEIFVYKNVNLGETDDEKQSKHRSMKRNGAIVLNGTNKDFPADVGTLSTKLSLSEVREIYSIINERFHSTVGVPMETSNTNSGGTTKSGSEVANGYDNAYNRALDDINTFIKADTELLEKIMWICKNTPNNKIDNVYPSDIEIKYPLNMTDNILTKTQSYVNLVQSGVPPTIALRLCKLSNDPEAEGKMIEDYMAEKEKRAAELQKQVSDRQPQKEDNNSQE